MDAAFCVDLSNDDPSAVAHARELDEKHERLAIPAPAFAEFLVGGFAKGGRRLEAAINLVSRMEVLPVDETTALEAARMGGQAIRDGNPIGTMDLLIAAVAKAHRSPIVTRDRHFSDIPGLTIETY